MLKDINPGGSSNPEGFTMVGSEVFFFADDGVHGEELWKTNGTTAGTVMVQDINPGASGSAYIIPYYTEMNGKFYFNATDGVNGTEPWESDGTAAGTRMLYDIRSGQFGSNPNGFFGYNGVVYMSAYTTTDGFELWATDGSETSQIYSFQTGTSCGCPADFTFFNSKIFFTADNGFSGREMWSMDPLFDVLPVEFGSFEAHALADGTVKLDWITECRWPCICPLFTG
jgi:ELWxxDGT repeat protein